MVELARADPSDAGVRKGSLVDEAYAALKRAIRDTVFAPGYQGSEQEIAVRLGMSRTPVHEAIIRLQEDGLVRVLSKRGVLICPLAPQDMREIYEVVIAVESMAAELLAASPGRRARRRPTSWKPPPPRWTRRWRATTCRAGPRPTISSTASSSSVAAMAACAASPRR